MATLRLMRREENRTCFNHLKSVQELGLSFRTLEVTIADTVAWYREHGGFGKHNAVNTA
jgi:nucleoside-diphosphate-sugar epimerase